jgi:hypothetical protein
MAMPLRLGRLPALIGEPAGGSLTADQWVIYGTIAAPLSVSYLFPSCSHN